MSNAFSTVVLADGTSARAAWPFAPNIVPLNHGSYGAVPRDVIAAQRVLQERADASPIGWFPHIQSHTKSARERISSFVGASSYDTVFVPNASAAASVVYNSLRLTAQDEILITDHGYGAVTMGAERLARRSGSQVRTVHIPLDAGDTVIADIFDSEIKASTRLVVVDHISSATAKVFPVGRIADIAHSRGARVLVDGAHAPGLIANAARNTGADWWFGNLHKWPSAPRGAALLVTSAPDRDDLWPLIDSWHAHLPYPERFDMQGTLDVTPYLASPVAVDWVESQYGWERARITLSANADTAADAIAEAVAATLEGDPRPAVPDPAPSMRLVRLPGSLGASRAEADGMRDRLYDATNIESAFTSFDGTGYLRISVHLYTTPDDISAFIDRAVPLLRRWALER